MFKFGKQKPDIKQYAIIGIVLSSIIGLLSQCTGIKQNNIWDLLDEVQRRYFPHSIINDFIIKDPEKLDRRIHRDVDMAIEEYERLTGDDGKIKIPKPRYSEKSPDSSVCYTKECQSLGGEMRLCAPWVDDCPKD
jgi:hypothetical protein